MSSATPGSAAAEGADAVPFLRASADAADWPANRFEETPDGFETDLATADPLFDEAPLEPRLRRVIAVDDTTLVALIGRVVERDQRALEALYDATSARVHGLVLRIVRRPALAEEVVEDTFWQVWRQAPRFDPARGRPVTWLLAMARSRAIDALRRDERFRHEELPEGDLLDAHAAAPPPRDLLEAARGVGALHTALAALDARARQLVSLAFLRGLTHEEIAERECMPLGSVKSVIRRALQQLRRTLEGGV